MYVGFDEFIYVTDADGLHVLDLAGRATAFIDIPGGATSVVQDRQFNLFVTARRDTLINGTNWSLPVVIKYANVTTGSPRIADIIWHPFDDDSRRFNLPDPLESDLEVEFTGVGILGDNSMYISRRGPVNERTSVILPHNTILEFNPEGVNVQALVALNPTLPNVRSSVNPADVLTVIHPPQRDQVTDRKDFFIAQAPPPGSRLQFAVLSILAVVTSDGIEYRPNTPLLTASTNPERGDGFLYEESKFNSPSDLAFAADETNYLFVLDAVEAIACLSLPQPA